VTGPILLFLCLLLSAAASYFLKLGATAGLSGAGWWDIAMHPMTMLGAACYAATFGLYALALQKVPLSLAQPVITGGASVVTALLAVMLLKETMGLANWLGLLLVCSGIFLLFVGRP
jgi:multidrug transporter EmrE-like cation transporter